MPCKKHYRKDKIVCDGCKKKKQLRHFSKSATYKDGCPSFHNRCRKCRLKYNRKWRRKYGTTVWRQLGFTRQDYQRLYKKQGGVCAICFLPETRVIKGKVLMLSVDHDHETGAIRGLLCSACNHALGLLQDDIDVVVSMAKYLSR